MRPSCRKPATPPIPNTPASSAAPSRAPCRARHVPKPNQRTRHEPFERRVRSEEHTSELQSPCNLVCRLLLEKKKTHLHTPSTHMYLPDTTTTWRHSSGTTRAM